MHRSETWTHIFEAESNANSSGVCLVRFGCLAANRPVFLFKQTPSSAVVRGGGISFFFFSEARTSTFASLSCYRFCLLPKGAHNFWRIRSEAWTKEILESSIVCLRATEDPSWLTPPFPSSLFSPAALFVFRLPPSFSSVCFLLAAALPPIPPHSALVWRFGSREWMFQEWMVVAAAG